jgi:Ni,Fe-hydrogenase III large subunit
LAGIDPCYCCTERMLIVDTKDKDIMNVEKLIKLSQEKTARLKEKMGIK